MGLAYVIVGLGYQEAEAVCWPQKLPVPQHRVGGTSVVGGLSQGSVVYAHSGCGLLQPGQSGSLMEVVEA